MRGYCPFVDTCSINSPLRELSHMKFTLHALPLYPCPSITKLRKGKISTSYVKGYSHVVFNLPRN